MDKTLKIANTSILMLVDRVYEFVQNEGGFISTSTDDQDGIYAYIVNYDEDNVHEEKVIAVKTNDMGLYIATCPNSQNCPSVMTLDEFTDDDWKWVSEESSETLLAPTILSIAESIDQYVEVRL